MTAVPSAARLREIQQTGDIFFPKWWMDATLDGHGSASAARLVQSLLERLPSGYPERLRRIVLSSADDLLRASPLTRRIYRAAAFLRAWRLRTYKTAKTPNNNVQIPNTTLSLPRRP
jgi:hypothetical protein